MNTFVSEFKSRLEQACSRADLETLHDWIWDRQQEIERTAIEINSLLRLRGQNELKPDLPCVTVGSTSGLVVVAANPGWKVDLNKMENDYCQRSKQAYRDLMFNFFHIHPIIRGEDYSKWWTRAMKFEALLPGKETADHFQTTRPARWEYMNSSGMLGGWDVFPWHSSKDRITSKIAKHAWLNDFCRASLGALLRMNPRLIFVASKAGYELLRNGLLSDIDWCDFKLAGTKCAYTNTAGNTEIVAVPINFLGAGVRSFTDEQLITKVRELRAAA